MLKAPRQTPSEVPLGLEEAIRVIRERAKALPFGSVKLTIHEGKVTQLEVNEKRRFGC